VVSSIFVSNSRRSYLWIRVGDTFEIGKDILGLPTINVESIDAAATDGSPVLTQRPELVGQASGSKQTGVLTVSTAAGATGRHVSFVTAHYEDTEESHGPIQERASSSARPVLSPGTEEVTLMQSPASYHLSPRDTYSSTSSPPTPANNSKTNLILPPIIEHNRPVTSKAHSDQGALQTGAPPAKAQRSTSLSSLRRAFSKDSKGKGRPTSFYSGPHIQSSSRQPPTQEPPPVPPAEVLTRDPTEEPSTSAGAAVILHQDLQPPTRDTDIVMRDRMLVRVLHCKQEGFTKYMDEAQLGEITDVKQEEWGEFIVVWRKGRIELYEDYVSVRSETPPTLYLEPRSIDHWSEGVVLEAQAPCICHPSPPWVYENIDILANGHVNLLAMSASSRVRIPKSKMVLRPRDGDEPIPAPDQEQVESGRLDMEAMVRRW